jgi:hypothetical protein
MLKSLCRFRKDTMMLPTHALVGLALALPVAVSVPEFGVVVLLAGLLGGVVPDLDMYSGHRRTLHFPTYYSALAVVAALVAVLATTPLTVALALFALAAAVHSVMDVFGGGLELRPWEGTSDRAVYDHHRRQWLAPRRWIRYDGAPEDLLLSVAVGLPLLVALDGPFRWVVISSLAVAAGYAAVRRLLPTIAEALAESVLIPFLPASVLVILPDRYLQEDTRS